MVLEYDGTNYAGFSPQPNLVTIHSCLTAAISKITGERPTLVVAGRTDSGVHARGQVVNFTTSAAIPAQRLAAALNSRMPPDVVVVFVAEVPPEFHAQRSAVCKTYSYTIWNHPVPSPLWRRFSYFEPRELDLHRMDQATKLLIGRHDFRAFRSTGGAARTSVRNIHRLEVHECPAVPEVILPSGVQPAGRHQARLIRIAVEGNGFLYNMVRILAGTLLEVGVGRRGLSEVAAALETGDRRYAGRTLPPNGLCLEWVHYPEQTS